MQIRENYEVKLSNLSIFVFEYSKGNNSKISVSYAGLNDIDHVTDERKRTRVQYCYDVKYIFGLPGTAQWGDFFSYTRKLFSGNYGCFSSYARNF